MKLGENILKFRKRNGLSQEQLGDLVKVTRQTISNWELGETQPNPEQLRLLSKALHTSIDELITGESTKDAINRSKGIYILFISLILIFVIAFIVMLLLFLKEKDKNSSNANNTSPNTTIETSKPLVNDIFIRTYEVLEISKVDCSKKSDKCDDTTYEITLKQCKGDTEKLQVTNIPNISNLEKGEVYEFKFKPELGEVYYEDTIKNLFAFNSVVSFNKTKKSCSNQIQDSIKTRNQ